MNNEDPFAMAAYIEKKIRNKVELIKVLGVENGECVYEMIRSEKRAYGLSEETKITLDIVELAIHGIPFEGIKGLIEGGLEDVAAYVLRYGHQSSTPLTQIGGTPWKKKLARAMSAIFRGWHCRKKAIQPKKSPRRSD